jgi:hypothetical protein
MKWLRQECQKLKPMKFREAMSCDNEKEWVERVDKKYKKSEDNQVFKAVKEKNAPKGSKIV